MNVSVITRGAIAVALIFVCFSLFKGPLNILNALLVPLILYISLLNQKLKEMLTVFAVALIFCFIFFRFQLFFIIIYCLIALLLKNLQEKRIKTFISVIVLSSALTLSFWLGVMLTDLVFSTHMNEIVLKLLNGNILVYAAVLLSEGAFIGVCQLLISKSLYKRMPRLQP
jgi:hypothetical protein